ncbi:DUF397 domain-containing protein [Spirillospora sp. NPDC052269]
MTDQPVWRKAKASGPEQGACIELADLTTAVGLRDSKAPGVGHLSLSRSALADLIGRVRGASNE